MLKELLPSGYRLRKARNILHQEVDGIIPIFDLDHKISGCRVRFADYFPLAMDKSYKESLKDGDVVVVKLGGDGREVGRNIDHVILCFSLVHSQEQTHLQVKPIAK